MSSCTVSTLLPVRHVLNMTARYDHATRTLWLSVGDLVAAEHFPGGVHLGPILRQRAAMGRQVHAEHQAAQLATQASYRAEVTIHHQLVVDNDTVHIQGRIDGLYEEGETLIVEEIKSLLIPDERLSQITLTDYPAYERQLSLYVYLLCQQHSGPVQGVLVLVNLADSRSKVLVVEPDLAASEALLRQDIRRILARYEARAARVARRQSQVDKLHFPFPTLRTHQDTMLEQVRLAVRDQSCVLLSAPTGIGKTIAALYPALEHALRKGLRVFVVTAKTTQQYLAVDTLQRLVQQGVQFTAVHLRAKEKSCLNEVYYCHDSVCEFARDYTGKLERSGLVEELLNLPVVEPATCAEVGQVQRVCPFELSLDVASEADVIIGDYNYVFDPGAYLRRFFQETSYDDCVLIIDEAHNLYGRSRDYYSPVLTQGRIRQLLAHCANEPARLFRDFEAFFENLDQVFSRLYTEAPETPEMGESTLVDPPLALFADGFHQLEALMVDYAIYRRRGGHAPRGNPIQDFYYAFGRFCDVLALGGDEFAYLYQHHPGDATFKILCKDASRFLHQRLTGFHSIIAMSATLTPFAFYQDVLGFPPDRTFTAEFPSPFPAENRKILVIPEVSTAYRDRQRDAPKVARIIETIVAQRPGNYIAFFPSFVYLRQVRTWLQLSGHCLIEQSQTMTESDRTRVLHGLRQRHRETRLVLAVQGGIFAEGVDYPGEMLVGAIIVGPGLPRMDAEQELIRAYYEERYNQGFAYAYLYPGMNRVIQSAGRVIRSETDVGIIALLGKRFNYRSYAALFPSHWYGQSFRELVTRDYRQALERFWRQHG
ncbi:3'-5' exonuclease DinG [Candidatus Entotheonellaceae bacterium PAL068K]